MFHRNQLVGALQARAARSHLLAQLAVKLKGQCDSIIGRRLSSGIDLHTNGEGWLVERVAMKAHLFVDVGANVGAWALHFAARMPKPRGLLLEPAPSTVARLREILAEARLPGLEIVAAAAGDTAGTAPFQAEADFGETSSLVVGHSRKDAKSIVVPVVTLDQILGERGIETVDVLKVDAEGYDLKVLQGARGYLSRQAIKVIQFEYNAPWAAAGSTLAAAYHLLESCGYTVRVLRRDGLWTFDPRTTGEFYRYANFVAWCPGSIGNSLDTGHTAVI